MQSSFNSHNNKMATVLAMLSITILLVAWIFTGKYLSIGSHLTTAGSLILPVWFILNDIITEVYGYIFSKRLLHSTIFCLFIFCSLTSLLAHIPNLNDLEGQSGYLFIFGKFHYYYLIGVVALFISGIVNIFAVSKWKILTQGRSFWLRSLGSSTIGEFLYSLITCLLVFGVSYLSPLNNASLSHALNIMITAYITKVVYTIILAWPANILAQFIKNYEGIDVYDRNINFNPFKL